MTARTASRPLGADLAVHLRRARDHIDRHYATAAGPRRARRASPASRSTTSRGASRPLYGETPIRYVTRRRIERAQDLLRHANLTVTEICTAVGFASLGSFSSRFSELVGESPSAYRARWAARGAPHVPGCWLFMRGVLDLGGTSGAI